MARLTVIGLIFFYAMLVSSPVASGDQIAITEDGRKVLLKDDGTWEYVKEQKHQESSIKTSAEGDFPLRRIDSWVGEKFVFLPIGRDYKLLKGKEDQIYNSFDVKTWYTNLPYKEYVGRIAKVNSVNKKESVIGHDWIVELEIVDSKEKLVVKAQPDNTIPGIGLAADIDKARELWLNKTLWCKDEDISLLTYGKDTRMPGERIDFTAGVLARRYSPVKVAGVVAGNNDHRPVRLILRTSSGLEGYIDMNLSGTNVASSDRTDVLERLFYTENPREKYKWSDKVWSAIIEGKVFIGMTDQQAKMSWGEPNDVNKTISAGGIHEQWIYGMNQYLYFDNGILQTIQSGR